VNSDGSLGGYRGEFNSKRKVLLLKNEGVKVEKGKVVCFGDRLFRFLR
jgi:hypothetical protein